MLSEMKSEMRAALEYQPGDDDPALLRRQILALDRAFRLLLCQADDRYEKIQHYQTAFKAQNQCRQTFATLNALKNHKSQPAKDSQT